MTHNKNQHLYQKITSQFIEALKTGAPPWVKPWDDVEHRPVRPRNAYTERKYSGVNVTILWTAATTKGFKTDRWLTFNQTMKAGGKVKKGEKGTVAILYRDIDICRKDENGKKIIDEDGEYVKDTIKYIRGFTLFNVEQCEGLADKFTTGNPKHEDSPEWNSHEEVDALLNKIKVLVRHDSSQAAYYPKDDVIRMPKKNAFRTDSCYYSTLLHELIHWTGHQSRLNRPGIAKPYSVNKSSYAFEELIAEIGSAFLCAEFGIQCDFRHEAYVLSWITELENDTKAIFETSALAWKARNYIIDNAGSD